jgi:hypothetical protein
MTEQATDAPRPALRVFLSWSGNRSEKVARALEKWLPTVVQGCDPWMSQGGIGAGVQWQRQLGDILEKADFGIICVTRDNAYAPWLLFEAGALGKRYQEAKARVVPFLLDGPLPEKHPLAIYQRAVADAGGVRELVRALWDACGAWLGVDGPTLRDELLDDRWPALEKKIAEARAATEDSGSSHWSARVPCPPQSEREELNRQRQSIADKARDALRPVLEGPIKEVRSNAFFLDLDRARQGIVELRMAEWLHAGGEFEKAVHFRQNQGLTGHAFQHRCRFAAWGRTPPGGDGWQLTDFGAGYPCEEAALKIGDQRQKALEQQMRWIFSIPLLDGDRWPLGVFNIDGFNDDLPHDRREAEAVFETIHGAVKADLDRFASLLRNTAGRRLRLAVE